MEIKHLYWFKIFQISKTWSLGKNVQIHIFSYFFQFGTVETLIINMVDAYPVYLRRHKTLLLAGACIVLLLLGIPFVTRVSNNIIHLSCKKVIVICFYITF